MSYCIKPGCPSPQNPDEASYCKACGSKLLIDGQYRATRLLNQRESCSSNAILVQVFEAIDDRGTAKVLKVLYDTDPPEVSRFMQEARVLIELSQHHRELPKVEPDGYFTFNLSPNNRSNPVYCLVMEKIEGTNLQMWVQEHGRIDENQAVEWLRQLAAILDQVHQQGFFHRDIKPTNIMRRSGDSTQLALIDFGAVRETTKTYKLKVGKGEVTRVYSIGYTPLEQLQGNAVPQSDFFSLGRTFVYLLTGEEPRDLDFDPRVKDKLIWRDKAQVSKRLGDLIDKLMAPSPEARPQDARAILQQLDRTENPHSRKWLLRGLAGVLVGGLALIATIFFDKEKCSTFTAVRDVPKGVFNYGGSTTWAPVRDRVDAAIHKALPAFELRYIDPPPGSRPGSGTGIPMLLEGRLNFSQSSRSPKKEEYEQARMRGFGLRPLPVAIDAPAVVVNPQNQIPGLTLAQLSDIYTGKIHNWQEVGGPKLAIAPYSRQPEDSGTAEFFVEQVLGQQSLGSNVMSVYSTTDGMRQVAKHPGGIYYASAPEAVPQCTVRPLPLKNEQSGKFIPPYQGTIVPLQSCRAGKKNQLNKEAFKSGDYPLTRELFVIIKEFSGGNNLEEQSGKAYYNLLLTDEGQRLIEAAGYTPIRSTYKDCSP